MREILRGTLSFFAAPPVILSTAKNLRVASEILRGAQNDSPKNDKARNDWFWNWALKKTSLCKPVKGMSLAYMKRL